MKRPTQKKPDAYHTDYYYQKDSRYKSPASHLTGSLPSKDEYSSTVYQRKGSYNTPIAKEVYTRGGQQEKKVYEPYGNYQAKSFLEDSSARYNGFSSTGNLNSYIQSSNRERIFDQKDSSIRRESSLHYRRQPSGNLQRSYLEDSRTQPISSNYVQRQDRYYPNTHSPLLTQHSYRKEPIHVPSDRRQSILRQIQPRVQQEPYFQYVLRYSYRSKRGYAPNNPSKLNQDAFVTIPNINSQTFLHYFGVCDGHGVKGHLVSSFIKNKLPTTLSKIKNLKNPSEQLVQSYKIISDELLDDQSIDTTYSGSTCVGVYLNHNKLYCSNVGDSRAILGKKSKNGQWSSKDLSVDHKPCLEREANRIIKSGGRIDAYKDLNGQAIGPLRVWFKESSIPGLAMTRSFGDTIASPIGVNSIPQISQYTLSMQDKIIVIASDGLWQFLSSQQVIDVLAPYYDQSKIQQSCNNLLQTAIEKWKAESTCLDDITFVVLFLDYSFD